MVLAHAMILSFEMFLFTSSTLCQGVYHGHDLIVPKTVDLKGLGGADAGTYAATHAFDFIMTDPAVLADVWRIERAEPEAGQA
jgi:hypothetical protein